MEVQRRLKISFEALTHEEQQIFLDVVCFFIGHSKTGPCYMWEDYGFYPRNVFNILVLRSPIKVGDDDTFQMHDQLRDLGRHIVHKGKVDDWGSRSRLWNTDKEMEVYTTGQVRYKLFAYMWVEHFIDMDLECLYLVWNNKLFEHEMICNGGKRMWVNCGLRTMKAFMLEKKSALCFSNLSRNQKSRFQFSPKIMLSVIGVYVSLYKWYNAMKMRDK
ncbi:hypothetical protein LguiA_030489 [Lonicera macranthoides]